MDSATSEVDSHIAVTETSHLTPIRRSTRARANTRAGLALILCIGLTACAAPKPPPNVIAGTFANPAVSLDSTAKRHQVLIETPSPGWVPSMDQSRADFRTTSVYLSLRKPNPAYLYPQVISTQRVATGVPADHAISVYVRTLDFDAPVDSDAAYQQAVEFSGQ